MLLYTEMVTAAALVYGDAGELLRHDPIEHPVALQIGGSDPQLLAQATRVGARHGFAEVNLNVGCPSTRVQSGCFGAVLMTQPDTVRRGIAAMQSAAPGVAITVKCRIGVDGQTPAEALPAFLDMLTKAGVTRVIIHARKAWLQGLSPKENRDIPPLDYPLVHQMKAAFGHLHLSINGGVETCGQAADHLAAGMDGVMVGRAAYHHPAKLLCPVETAIFGGTMRPDPIAIAHAMGDWIDQHLASGGRLHHVTRHMLGLFAGGPGARAWRRALSDLGAQAGATVRDYRQVVAAMEQTLTRANRG